MDSDNLLREKLERMVGADDSRFSGIDLATLIRNKYGKSYDVQLIKKVYSSSLYDIHHLNQLFAAYMDDEKVHLSAGFNS